jgi:hypothetical protein
MSLLSIRRWSVLGPPSAALGATARDYCTARVRDEMAGTVDEEQRGLMISRDLKYVDGGAVRALPHWADWFVDLGRWAAMQRCAEKRLVAVATVPVGGFAAVFVALGSALTNYRDRSPEDEIAHFEHLCSLPAGTRVEFRKAVGSNKLTTGSIVGPTERQIDGRAEPYLQLAGGTLRPWWNCGDVTAVADAAAPFVHDRVLAAAPEFVQASVGVDPVKHALYTSLDCLIVGTKIGLEHDVASLRLSCQEQAGTLQDLLRCRTLLRPADHYRTDMRGALTSVSDDDRVLDPPTIVLEGSAAVLNWRNVFRESPAVFVIDRSSPSAEAARDAVTADRAASVRDIENPVGDCPAGVELLVYEERLR